MQWRSKSIPAIPRVYLDAVYLLYMVYLQYMVYLLVLAWMPARRFAGFT